MSKNETSRMIAGRKAANHHRPTNMPNTAIQHNGIWYRNARALRNAQTARRTP